MLLHSGGSLVAHYVNVIGNIQTVGNRPQLEVLDNEVGADVQGNKEDQCVDLRREAGSNPAQGPVSPASATAGSGGWLRWRRQPPVAGAALALLALCKLGTPARLLRVARRRAGRGERT